MGALTKTREFISNLDLQTFYLYTLVALASIALFFGFMIYRTFSTITTIQERTETINEYRQEAQEIIARSQQVKKQRAKVNEILTQDRRFKITNYLNTLVTDLGLGTHLKEEPRLVEQDLDQQYKEVRLSPIFEYINMRQLTKILKEIEESERVYVKKLNIVKAAGAPPSINATIHIATLQLHV